MFYMFLEYISIPAFLFGLFIGILFIYILGPNSKEIYVYPSPENVGKLLYKDKADNCFILREDKITCPKNKSEISIIPSQE